MVKLYNILACQTTNGEACTFPFTYGGTVYNKCTTAANNGVPWCTTSSGWGNCQQSCASSVTTGELELVLFYLSL